MIDKLKENTNVSIISFLTSNLVPSTSLAMTLLYIWFSLLGRSNKRQCQRANITFLYFKNANLHTDFKGDLGDIRIVY